MNELPYRPEQHMPMWQIGPASNFRNQLAADLLKIAFVQHRAMPACEMAKMCVKHADALIEGLGNEC
jgi:hypothetical protein